MAEYLWVVRALTTIFEVFIIEHVSWEQNSRANQLARLASALEDDESTMIEYLPMTSITVPKAILVGVMEEEPTWMDLIRAFLEESKLPDECMKSRTVRFRAFGTCCYTESYIRGAYLRCLSPTELELAMKKIHKGLYGNHLGGRSMVHRLIKAEYYWPTM